jgi:LEA14-like dessication related protein
MKRRIGVLLAIVLLASGGCAPLGYKLESPRLSVVGAEFVKGDLLQQNLRVHLHVLNPNRVALPVRGLSYELEIAGERFAHGETEREFIVPASGEADFDVAVTSNAAGALLKIANASMRGEGVPYRLYGNVNLKSALLRSLPFEQRGRFDLR